MLKKTWNRLDILHILLMFIVIVVMLVNIAIIIYMQRSHTSYIEKENLNYLDSVYTHIERDITVRIPELSLSVFLPEDYWKYHNAYNSNQKNVLYLRLREDLRRTLYATDEIYDYAMYYPQTEELISAKHGYFQLSRNQNTAYRIAYNIDKAEQYQYGINSALSETSDLDFDVTVTYKFDNGTMLIFCLGKEYFDSFFIGNYNDSASRSSIFITNGENVPIYVNGTTPNEAYNDSFMKILEDTASFGTRTYKKGVSTLIVTSKALDSLPLIIVKATPEHFVIDVRSHLILLFCSVFLIFVAVMAGIVIPKHLTRKIYNPIYKLAGHIDDASLNEAENTAPNQLLQKIGNYMVDSKNELHQIRQLLDNSQNALKENFIKYLFQTANSDSSLIKEYTSILKLELPEGLYFPGYIILEQPEFTNMSVTDFLLLKIQLAYELENNISSDNLKIFCCNDSENTLALMIQTQTESWHDSLNYINSQLYHFLTNIPVRHFLAIGPGQQKLEQLSTSARIANDKLQCHMYIDANTTCYIADELHDISDVLPPLRSILGTNPSTADIKLLLETSREYFSRHPFEAESCQKTMAQLISLVFNLFKAQNTPQDPQTLARIMYPYDYFWNVADYLKYLSDILLNQPKDLHPAPKDIHLKMIQYIDANLDNDISLENIADYVNLSPKYVSKIFKEKTGENLTTYISNLRIDRAVELLRYTDKNVETIAYETGFSSSNYFIKCFKAKMGMSPKAYRDTLLQKETN